MANSKIAANDPNALRIRLQPKQWELSQLFEKSEATWIGYGGSRGGAKSGGLRRIMLDRRLRWPGTSGLIFRRVYEELKKNHIDKMFADFPQLRKYWHATDHEIVLPTNNRNEAPSRIVFGYAETADELKRKFFGQEYMDIMVDQGEQLTEEEHRNLKMSCRWPGIPDYQCKYAIFFNPGGVGLKFLKAIFKDGKLRERESANDFAFIQAYGWDNVEWVREALRSDYPTVKHAGCKQHTIKKPGCEWCQAKEYYRWTNEQRFDYFISRSQYGRNLNALPEALRIGHLLGSLDVFAGQYFDNFDPEQHVLDGSKLGIKPWHPKWLSMDWGFSHPTVVHWHAIEDGTVKTYRERIFKSVGPRAIAQEICDEGRRSEEKYDAFYLSPDAFAKRTTEDSIAEQMRGVLLPNRLPAPSRADDDRVGGWMLMREMLQYRKWIIASSCTNLIDTLPLMSRDDTKVEDCVKFNASEGESNGDDSADCARYGLKSRMGDAPVPHDIQLKQELDKVAAGTPSTDLGDIITNQHIAHLRFEHRFRQQNRPWRRPTRREAIARYSA